MKVCILADGEAIAGEAAARFAECARAAVAARGQAHIALSGGNTPRALYRRLAAPEYAAQVDWPRVHLWWSDERDVPADHPDSNYRMAAEALIGRVPIPPDQVHRVPAELGAVQAAAQYETHIIERLSQWLNGSMTQSPNRFDLILLGLGDDGHTASLFPGTLPAIPTDRLVIAHNVPKAGMMRITFTPRLINAARQVLFLVSGQGKAEAVRQVLCGPRQPDVWPAQIVAPTDGDVIWLIDRAAAGDKV